MSEIVTQPMCVHPHDFDRNVANPDPIVTVRVQGLFNADNSPGPFGRLVHAIDTEGNLWPIVGLNPGRVTRCERCEREVYIPDAAEANRKFACPYRDCMGWIDKRAKFGDFLVEDEPGQTISGDCTEHGAACHAPKVQTEVAS